MCTLNGKCSTLALAITTIIVMLGWVVVSQTSTAGFIDDSTLIGNIYY